MIKALFLQGLAFKVISQRTGVKPETIRGKANYQGWYALRDSTIAKLSVNLTQPLTDSLAKQHSNTVNALAKASVIAQEAFSDELSSQVQVLRSNKPRKLSDLANTRAREGRASVVNRLVNTAAKLYGWDEASAQAGAVNLTQINVTSARTLKPTDKIIDVPYE